MPSIAIFSSSSAAKSAAPLPSGDGGVGCRHLGGLQRPPLFCRLIANQSIFAHYFKLLTLFAVAISHVFYMRPFLNVFNAIADFSNEIHASRSSHSPEAIMLNDAVEYLNDYKKNMWMTVGAMCVALSTGCFFLMLYSAQYTSRFYISTVRVIDVLAFVTIPALLCARCVLIDNLLLRVGLSLNAARAINPTGAELLEHRLDCQFAHRLGQPQSELLPFCMHVVEGSILPIFLLKFLLILAVLTVAYLLTAYIIEQCIRHWFPHMTSATPCYRRPPPPNFIYSPLILKQDGK